MNLQSDGTPSSMPALLQESQRLRHDLTSNLERLRVTLENAKAVTAEWGWPTDFAKPKPERAPAALGLLDALTPREVEILRLISEGKSTKNIAKLKGIAFKTAACHRSRILQKLGMHETASLVRLAIRAGLIEP